MVLPKTMRREKFFMEEALSIVCMLATPGGEAVARMKARWAFSTEAACG